MGRINVYTGDSGTLRLSTDGDEPTERRAELAREHFRHEVLFQLHPASGTAYCYLQAVTADRSSPEQFVVEYRADGEFDPRQFKIDLQRELAGAGWDVLSSGTANQEVYESLGEAEPVAPTGLVAERLDELVASGAPLDFGVGSRAAAVGFLRHLDAEYDLDRPVAISNSGRVGFLADETLVVTPSRRYDGVVPLDDTAERTYRTEMEERLTAASERVDDAVGNLAGVADVEGVYASLAARLNEAGLSAMGYALETEGGRRRSVWTWRAGRAAFALALLPVLFVLAIRLEFEPLVAGLTREHLLWLAVTVVEVDRTGALFFGALRVATWQLLLVGALVGVVAAWPSLGGVGLPGGLRGGSSGGGSRVSEAAVAPAVEHIEAARDAADHLGGDRTAEEEFLTGLERRVLDGRDLVVRDLRPYRVRLLAGVVAAVVVAAAAAAVLGVVWLVAYGLLVANLLAVAKVVVGLAVLAVLARLRRFLLDRSLLVR